MKISLPCPRPRAGVMHDTDSVLGLRTFKKTRGIQKLVKRLGYREIQSRLRERHLFPKKWNEFGSSLSQWISLARFFSFPFTPQTPQTTELCDNLCDDSYLEAPTPCNSETIEHIICDFSNLKPGFLDGPAFPFRDDGKLREFSTGILEQTFILVLPLDIEVVQRIETFPDDQCSENCQLAEDWPVNLEESRSNFLKSAFLAQMPTWAHRVILKADPEDLVERLLPADLIPAGARHIATCFWSFLCVVDDLTEDGDCYNCIEACIESLSNVTTSSKVLTILEGRPSQARNLSETSKLDDCIRIIAAFHHAVNYRGSSSGDTYSHACCVEDEGWRADFWVEVLTVIKALQSEKSLHGRKFSMREWLQLRVITISARPFMVLLRANLRLPSNLSTCSFAIQQIQILIQASMGLQNDLLGWQKDHIEGNTLNAIEVLIGQGYPQEDAFQETLNTHNKIVSTLLTLSKFPCDNDTWGLYVRLVVSFCNGMAEWMLCSRRYQIRTVAVPGLERLMYHDSNTMLDGCFRL